MPSTRQSAGRARRAGLSGGLMRLTTNGADHQAKTPPTAAARKREPWRFPPGPVAPGASVRRRWRRAAPFRAPAPRPAPSSGWRRWRRRSAAPAPPGRRERAASGGSPAACPETPAAAGSSTSVWSRKRSMLCLRHAGEALGALLFEGPRGGVQFRAHRFQVARRACSSARVRCQVWSSRTAPRDASWWGRRCRSRCRARCR